MAIVMADQDGLDSLSMRNLGARLGVEAMSLYYYVPNKAALLLEMTDDITSKMYAAKIDGHWRQELHRSMRSAYDLLDVHHWAVEQFMSLDAGYPLARFQWMNAGIGCLRQNGFPIDLAHHAFQALHNQMIGFVLWANSLQVDEAQMFLRDDAALTQMEESDLPWLKEQLGYLMDNLSDDQDANEFEYALNLMLDSIERMAQDNTTE